MFSATSPDPTDLSDNDSTPVNKRMSDPQTVKASNAAGRKKLAAALASMYDPVEQITLKSSLYKRGSMEVESPDEIVDVCSLEPSTAAYSSNNGPTPARSRPAGDQMVDEVTHVDDHIEESLLADEVVPTSEGLVTTNIRTEWIGTSQFFIRQSVEWDRNVSSQIFSASMS